MSNRRGIAIFILLVVAMISTGLWCVVTADVPIFEPPNSGSELVHTTAQGQTLSALIATPETPSPPPSPSGTPKNVWVCPDGYRPQPTQSEAAPTCVPISTAAPRPTKTPDYNPLHVGGVAFDDEETPLTIIIDPQGLDLVIPMFHTTLVSEAFDFGPFQAFRPIAPTWLADGHVPVMVLHSGIYRGSPLPMWQVQQFLEVNSEGNRSTEAFIANRLDQLKDKPVILFMGDCGAPTGCRASLFKIKGAVRIPPDQVWRSQEYLRSGLETYLGIKLQDGFMIRTCGRQAAGGTYDGSRPPWQQARYMLAFEYVGGPIQWAEPTGG